jgi:hypothetical protein
VIIYDHDGDLVVQTAILMTCEFCYIKYSISSPVSQLSVRRK